MKLTFRIRYRTVWGENLCVLLNDDETQIISLSTRNGDEWQGSFEYIPVGSNQLVTYRYAVYRDNICIRKELGAISHLFYLGNAQQNHYVIDDCWRDLPADSYRYSSAFNSIYTPQSYNKLSDSVGSCITFRALCPELGNRNQALGLIGSCNALGSWEYCRPLRMQEVRPNVWYITLDASSLQLPFEYKFVAINAESGAVEEWESRPNRLFNVQPLQRGETYLPMETEVFFALPARKFAGSAIPVFSLRSEGSCGVGDFGDLKTFVSWAADTAQHVVQILPINDTSITGSWTDSYPYNSISIYAFHPMYIDLRQLPALADAQFASRFEEERARLNVLSVVDYEAVNRLKQSYLKEVYRQEGENVLKSDEFNTFFADNRHWLQPYAAFSYLRDLYGTSDFHCWEAYNKYDEEEIQQLCSPESDAYTFIGYYYYMQYLLHVQLLAVAEYARRKGVILKGDIPIGISRTSVESWVEPYYFNMNGQAGAPPDAFSVNGQNWGFPTYNWEVMEKDNYLWWRRRFAKMAEYFTASVHGLLGQFVPSLPMSADEIRSFGLNFRPDFMLRPFISEYILNTVFGEQSDYVRETFVRPLHHDLYEMRPEFDTQRKVEAFFEGKTDSESIWLKEKLYALISDVLFVADRNNPELYHPRIAVQNDYIFKQLAEQEQEAFNHLYNHYYYQRHNEFWYHEAMKKLPVLTQSTPMLVCGEDLGMVPDCVSWVMNELQILSLEIQRMPKAIGREFGCLNEYPFRSVCTIGTHDMPTLRGWWEEDAALAERFYHNELHHWGEVPKHAPGWLCKEIIEQHLQSPSMLCVLAWQDWTSIDESLRNPDVQAERINVPANPHNYWQWRMHITLEELMQADELNDAIRQMIQSSDRNTAC